MKKALCTLFGLLLFMQVNAAYQYKLSIGAIFRDEAPYLKEWIEFHKIVGVEHFYLYNHCSRDHFKEVLQPYVESGIVELIDWSFTAESFGDFCFKIQPGAYTDCVNRSTGKSEWVAFIDTDEYLTPLQANKVTTILKKFRRVGGVFINWQMFGTSGVAKIPPNKTSIEVLTMKALPEHINHRMGKSIVRPECVTCFGQPHDAAYKPGFYAVDAQKNILPPGPNNRVGPCIDELVINHYWTRDEYYCFNDKFVQYRRWHPDNPLEHLRWAADQMNQVQDTTMLRFVEQLRENMGLDD